MKKLLLCLSLLLVLVLVAVACDSAPVDGGETQANTGDAIADATNEVTDAATLEEATPTDAATLPVEEPTEAPTEAPTEEPTEAPTEAPTEPATEPDPTIPAHIIDAEMLADQTIIQSPHSHDLKGENAVVLNDGYVTITPDAGDPYYYPERYFDGARYIIIKYRTTNADGAVMQVYLDSYSEGPKDDSTMLQGTLVGDGEWHYLVLDTQPLMDSYDYDGEFVSHLRFDPLESGYLLDENGEKYQDEDGFWARNPLVTGASVDVAYIAFCHAENTMEIYEGNTQTPEEQA